MAGSKTKIADLEIKITNEAKGASASLNELKTALTESASAKEEFVKSFSRQTGFKHLEDTVTRLTKSLRPLATQMAKISKGFEAMKSMGIKSSNLSNATSKAKTTAEKVTDSATGTETATAGAPDNISAPMETASKSAENLGSKLDLLREKLELLKGKYASLSTNSDKALQANSVAMQIKNTEDAIMKLELAETGASVSTKEFADKMDGAKASSNAFGTSLYNLAMASSLSKTHIGKLATQFGRILRLKAMRLIVQQFYASISQGITNLYEYSRALNSLDSANFKNTMDGYSTSLQTMRNTIASALAPALQSLLPIIQTVINYFAAAINVINQFFSALQGKSMYTKAIDSAVEWGGAVENAAGGAGNAIDELKRTILAFDELNVLNDNNESGGSGGGGGGASTPDYESMFEETPIADWIKKLTDKIKPIIDWIKENFQTLLTIAEAIGVALLAWKIASGVSDFFSNLFNHMGLNGAKAGQIAFGVTLALVGFTVEALGAYDIGKNGLTLKNAIMTGLGAALGIAGMTIAFGGAGLVASIPLSILIGLTAFSIGKGDAMLEDSEWYQSAQERIAQVQGIVDHLSELSQQLDEQPLADIAEKVATAQGIINNLFNILESPNKTTKDIETIIALVNQFNDLELTDVKLEYDKLTDSINMSKDAIEELIRSYERQAYTEAYKDLFVESIKVQIDAEINKTELQKQADEAQAALDAWQAENGGLLDHLTSGSVPITRLLLNDLTGLNTEETMSNLHKLSKEQEALQKAVDDTNSALADATTIYNDATKAKDEYFSAWTDYENGINDTTDALRDNAEAVKEVNGTVGDVGSNYKNTAGWIEGHPVNFKGNSKGLVNEMTNSVNRWHALDFKEKQLTGNSKDLVNEMTNSVNRWHVLDFKEKQLTGNNTKLNSTIDSSKKKWNNTSFGTKSLTGNNTKLNSAIDSSKKKWNNTSFGTKSLTATASSAYSTVDNFVSYWKKLNLQRELGVKVNVTSSNGRIVAGGMVFQNYASGGYPDYGSMFVAGEAGAELVGNINGKTGVASQGEITGIRQSVESAGNTEARLLREQNDLLKAILAKEGNVNVTTASIVNGLNRTNRRTGKTVVAMGQ